jgi:hypothetical protein
MFQMSYGFRERYQRLFTSITIVLALALLTLTVVASALESFEGMSIVLRTAFVATVLIAAAVVYLRSARHYRIAAGICGVGLSYFAVSLFWGSLWPHRVFFFPLAASVLFAAHAGWAFLLSASENRG